VASLLGPLMLRELPGYVGPRRLIESFFLPYAAELLDRRHRLTFLVAGGRFGLWANTSLEFRIVVIA